MATTDTTALIPTTNVTTDTNRRQFLDAACKVCGMFAIGSVATVLAACAGTKTYKGTVVNKQIMVPLSAWPTKDGTPTNLMLTSVSELPHNIALFRQKDGTYYGLYMQCTHYDYSLDLNKEEGFRCHEHGSMFDQEGKVIKGPAAQSMRRFVVTQKDQNLVVQLS
jgi:Rieske Fe-S protein